jgi:hypothetical protein
MYKQGISVEKNAYLNYNLIVLSYARGGDTVVEDWTTNPEIKASDPVDSWPTRT